MSVSLVIISVVILLIMFGAGQRILDSMRLSDKEALVILIAICIGIIIPPIWIGEYFCFSIGGFLIPLGLSIYLLISCGWSRDLLRAFFGTIIVGGVIYGLEWLLPANPENVIIDNMYIYGFVAGIVAYLLGRSRRNAFVSCLFGLSLAQLVQWIINLCSGTPTILGLGVGGAFGTYVVALVISVAVSEFLGRCFESAYGDKEKKKFNYETHTYDSEKNGKLNLKETQKTHRKNELKSAKTKTKSPVVKKQKTAKKEQNSENLQKLGQNIQKEVLYEEN